MQPVVLFCVAGWLALLYLTQVEATLQDFSSFTAQYEKDIFLSGPSPRGGCPEVPNPPFPGTVYIDPDIILPSDGSSYLSITPLGQSPVDVQLWDYRVGDWIYVKAFQFIALFSDDLSVLVNVNPEFGSSAACEAVSVPVLEAMGRLPTVLRENVAELQINGGRGNFGGNSVLRHITLNIDNANQGIEEGWIEEAFFHEGCHVNLDSSIYNNPDWFAAANMDNKYISSYARDHPNSEDAAESILPWFAVRYRSDRIPECMALAIESTIPNRINFFDNLNLNLP